MVAHRWKRVVLGDLMKTPILYVMSVCLCFSCGGNTDDGDREGTAGAGGVTVPASAGGALGFGGNAQSGPITNAEYEAIKSSSCGEWSEECSSDCSTLTCGFALPEVEGIEPAEMIELATVLVVEQAGSVVLPRVSGESCGTGWYVVEDLSALRLCESSCAELRSRTNLALELIFGCLIGVSDRTTASR